MKDSYLFISVLLILIAEFNWKSPLQLTLNFAKTTILSILVGLSVGKLYNFSLITMKD